MRVNHKRESSEQFDAKSNSMLHYEAQIIDHTTNKKEWIKLIASTIK
jgi:hypothetical protein